MLQGVLQCVAVCVASSEQRRTREMAHWDRRGDCGCDTYDDYQVSSHTYKDCGFMYITNMKPGHTHEEIVDKYILRFSSGVTHMRVYICM